MPVSYTWKSTSSEVSGCIFTIVVVYKLGLHPNLLGGVNHGYTHEQLFMTINQS